MDQITRQHFFHHGQADISAEERARCHLCQLRRFRTHEHMPVSIVNRTGDGQVLRPNFQLIEGNIVRPGVPVPEPGFRTGCSCEDAEQCAYSTCHCLDELRSDDEDEDEPFFPGGGGGRRRGASSSARPRKKRIAYHASGRKRGLLRGKFLDSRDPIYECHDECACSPDSCPNRVVERGRTLPLEIFRTDDGRGWGVRCSVDIRKGQFVDKYVGEVITHEEADRRRQRSTKRKEVYLFALDKFYNKTSPDPLLRKPPIEVDGEFFSGPSRFINHNCDPNMRIFARVGAKADKHIHDLAFFAVRDIPRMEELTFDYVDGLEDMDSAPSSLGTKEDMERCLCKSENCRGFLW